MLAQIEKKLLELVNKRTVTLTEVSGGISTAKTFKAETEDENFFVKIISCDEKRGTYYNFLQGIACENIVSPKIFSRIEKGNYCIISSWIDGDNIEEKLEFFPLDTQENLGKKAGDIICSLHERKIDYPEYLVALKSKVCLLCEKAKKYGLKFEGITSLLSRLENAVGLKSCRSVVLTHNDVRPENFIYKGGDLYLIDFENGGIGAGAIDFSYATTLGKPQHRTFYYNMIKRYLEKEKYENFWQDNLFYSAYKLLDYAVWKWENKEKQVKFQAENFAYQYDNFQSLLPRWFKEME